MEFAEGNIIARYILDKCNKEEKQYVKIWLSENQYNKLFYNHIEQSLQLINK